LGTRFVRSSNATKDNVLGCICLSQERIDVKEKMEELFQTFENYGKKLKLGPGDTNVVVKSWNFNVEKKDRDYIVDVEVDLTLTLKSKQNTIDPKK
jgi:hypothetical protein